MLIDFHVHAFPDKLAPKAIHSLMHSAGTIFEPQTNGTFEDALRKMAEWKVDAGVLQPIATTPKQQHTINDWAAEHQCREMICFGSVHPDAPDAVDELTRIVELGLHGVKLHPDYQGFFADDHRIDPIYAWMSELGLPVLFHGGWDPESPAMVHTSPARIANIHKRFPHLKIISAHLGGFRMYDEVEQCLVGKNIWFDLSLAYRDCSAEQFSRIVRRHGAERILFATDCPWSTPQQNMELLLKAGLSGYEMDKICYENAMELLALPYDYFD